jgi:hypothetical protein
MRLLVLSLFGLYQPGISSRIEDTSDSDIWIRILKGEIAEEEGRIKSSLEGSYGPTNLEELISRILGTHLEIKRQFQLEWRLPEEQAERLMREALAHTDDEEVRVYIIRKMMDYLASQNAEINAIIETWTSPDASSDSLMTQARQPIYLFRNAVERIIEMNRLEQKKIQEPLAIREIDKLKDANLQRILTEFGVSDFSDIEQGSDNWRRAWRMRYDYDRELKRLIMNKYKFLTEDEVGDLISVETRGG